MHVASRCSLNCVAMTTAAAVPATWSGVWEWHLPQSKLKRVLWLYLILPFQETCKQGSRVSLWSVVREGSDKIGVAGYGGGGGMRGKLVVVMFAGCNFLAKCAQFGLLKQP